MRIRHIADDVARRDRHTRQLRPLNPLTLAAVFLAMAALVGVLSLWMGGR